MPTDTKTETETRWYRVFLSRGTWRETGTDRSQPLSPEAAALTYLVTLDVSHVEPEIPKDVLRKVAPGAFQLLETQRLGNAYSAEENYFLKFPNREKLYRRVGQALDGTLSTANTAKKGPKQ